MINRPPLDPLSVHHTGRLRPLALTLALLLLTTAGLGAGDQGSKAQPSSGGTVVSGEADATAVGLAILERGGNAVDAAVATALALAVVHPEAGNLGGGGFAVVRVGGEVAALDFREVAPAAASAAMYLDADGQPRPGASMYGPLAAGVPGSPAGYHELHRRYGRLPWPEVVAPAVALARDGFEVSARTAKSLAEGRDQLARFAPTAAVWLPGGRPLGAGERLRLPGVARTLAAYATAGPTAITRGPVAAAIETASRQHGGVLTAADLAAYQPVWREPLRFERFGWQLAAMPLPSSGGVIVGQVLAMLERRGWRELPPGGSERAHLLVEAFRRAFADRFLLGDPATSLVPLETLLDAAWLDRRAASIDLTRAFRSEEVTPYSVARDADGKPAAGSREPSETTHVSVVDRNGNLAALTTTVNDLFGCRLWVDEIGFLNDQMDDFTTAPGRPNDYGLIQGDANRIAPGKKMLSSMSPTLAWRGDEAIAVGGRGGSRIPTGVVQVLLALWDGETPRSAVARPRLHQQWLPDRVEVEPGGLAASDTAELTRLGHILVVPTALPKVNVAMRHADGTTSGAGDPRGPEVAGTIR